MHNLSNVSKHPQESKMAAIVYALRLDNACCAPPYAVTLSQGAGPKHYLLRQQSEARERQTSYLMGDW
jgi:hypothetical protein